LNKVFVFFSEKHLNLKPIQTNNYLICTAAAGLKGMGRGLQKYTPYLIAAVLKKSPEGYFGNGAYPLGCSI
jgi:hypothetical protein